MPELGPRQWTGVQGGALSVRVGGRMVTGRGSRPSRGSEGRQWAGYQPAGGADSPAQSGQEGAPLLTPCFLCPHSWPLTHQQQCGAEGALSGHLPGANAAPHSPRRPSHWAPPRSRAAAGPAEGPSPGRPPQPAGRWTGLRRCPALSSPLPTASLRAAQPLPHPTAEAGALRA